MPCDVIFTVQVIKFARLQRRGIYEHAGILLLLLQLALLAQLLARRAIAEQLQVVRGNFIAGLLDDGLLQLIYRAHGQLNALFALQADQVVMVHRLYSLVARSAVGIHNALYRFLSHQLFQIAVYGSKSHSGAGLTRALEQLLGAHGRARAYEQTPQYTLLTGLTLGRGRSIIHSGHFLWRVIITKTELPFFQSRPLRRHGRTSEYIMRDEY